MSIDCVSGEQLAETIKRSYSLPAAVIDEQSSLIRPPCHQAL
jgi:hypothetical protein